MTMADRLKALFNPTIKIKLIGLSLLLLLFLLGTNIFMRSGLVSGNSALQSQSSLYSQVELASETLRVFGELKYWLTDLEVSWLNESEENADLEREKLNVLLAQLETSYPDEVAEIRVKVETFVTVSIEAVDAYVDENRVLGNSLVSKARAEIVAITGVLTDIFEELKEQARRLSAQTVTAAENTIFASTIALVLALLITSIATFFVIRSIVGPLTDMTEAMGLLAEGQDDVEVPAVGRADEIGTMAAAVSVFKENALERQRLEHASALEAKERHEREEVALIEERERIEGERKEQKKISISKEVVAAQMERLIVTFDKTAKGLLDKVSEAAADLELTAVSLTSTAKQTNERSASVAAAAEEATTNVQTVASATEELSASIAEIGHQIERSTEANDAAAQKATEASKVMEELDGATQAISEVIQLINDIANQTNLLALNATIEAARAGEAGRGFAVVASEVKSLAAQTSKATEQIERHIALVQDKAFEALSSMGDISGAVQEAKDLAGAVVGSVNQQQIATSEISSNVLEAAKGTTDVNLNINDVAQGAAETMASSEHVLSASNDVSEVASKLQHEVQSFLRDVNRVLQ